MRINTLYLAVKAALYLYLTEVAVMEHSANSYNNEKLFMKHTFLDTARLQSKFCSGPRRLGRQALSDPTKNKPPISPGGGFNLENRLLLSSPPLSQ